MEGQILKDYETNMFAGSTNTNENANMWVLSDN